MSTLTQRHPDETATIRRITSRLSTDYAGRCDVTQVQHAVAEAAERLAAARVRTFISVLTERLARQILDSMCAACP